MCRFYGLDGHRPYLRLCSRTSEKGKRIVQRRDRPALGTAATCRPDYLSRLWEENRQRSQGGQGG